MYVSDQFPFAVLVTDREKQLTYVNAAAETLLQEKFTALRGKPLPYFIQLSDALMHHFDACLRHGVMLKAYDQAINIRNRRSVRAHVHLAPVYHGTGEPEGLMLAVDVLEGADIADRQQAQQELAKQTGLMAAMLAHEIKNPLSSIRSAAQLLEEDFDIPPPASGGRSGGGNIEPIDSPTLALPRKRGREMLGLIVRESDRITETLRHVEFLQENAALEKQPVNIHEVLHYVRSVLDPKLGTNILFEERFDPTLPDIHGHRDALIQLFLNLVKNAAEIIQETPQPKIILSTGVNHAFSLRVEGKKHMTLQVSVIDNGPGVPEEVQGNLFSPFVTTKRGGRGLGLMIAAKIAADHHGLLELAASAPGRTVFRVLLPV